MKVDVQILRTDDTITAETHDTRKRTVPYQLVNIVTRLRRADSTIAAMWSPRRPDGSGRDMQRLPRPQRLPGRRCKRVSPEQSGRHTKMAPGVINLRGLFLFRGSILRVRFREGDFDDRPVA